MNKAINTIVAAFAACAVKWANATEAARIQFAAFYVAAFAVEVPDGKTAGEALRDCSKKEFSKGKLKACRKQLIEACVKARVPEESAESLVTMLSREFNLPVIKAGGRKVKDDRRGKFERLSEYASRELGISLDEQAPLAFAWAKWCKKQAAAEATE